MFTPQVGFAVSLVLALGLVVWFLLKIRIRWLRITSIICLFAAPALVVLVYGSFFYGMYIGYLSELLRQSSVDANKHVRTLTLIEKLQTNANIDPWLEHNVKHNLENEIDMFLSFQEDFIKNSDQIENKLIRHFHGWEGGTNNSVFRRDMPEVTAYRRTHPGCGYHTNYNDILKMI